MIYYINTIFILHRSTLASETETMSETYMCADADVVITAYGTSARICRKAVKMLRAEGIKTAFSVRSIFTLPLKELKDAVLNAKKCSL